MSDRTPIEARELGKTHVQFFRDGICLGTIRAEYADGVKAELERQDAISDKGTVPFLKNQSHTEKS